mgnify:CR=1 FL=1
MQKEIQLTDKTLLVVGLKRNCTRVRHLETINDLEIVYGDIIFGKEYEYIKLVGNYELLGIYPELTEDMAHSLVEHTFDGNLKKYFNYKKGYYSHSLFTALESFQSLMERENITGYDKYAILYKEK